MTQREGTKAQRKRGTKAQSTGFRVKPGMTQREGTKAQRKRGTKAQSTGFLVWARNDMRRDAGASHGMTLSWIPGLGPE